MEEFFRSELGINYAEVLHKRHLSFPTVHVQSDFRLRLRYGDQIAIQVRVINVGRTSITWGYEGYRLGNQEELVVEGQNVTVCVKTETFKKREIPVWVRKGLTAYMERFHS